MNAIAHRGLLLLAVLLPLELTATGAAGNPATSGTIADLQLARIQHHQNILPDVANSGFGALLYDEHGELVLHDGSKTWLYTTTVSEAPSDGYIAARCGGNLAANFRIGGKHVLFYYSRPNKEKIMLTAALSEDALFQHITKLIEFEPPLGDEQVIEKFESYAVGNELHLIYENRLASGHWGTGMRVYKILDHSRETAQSLAYHGRP